MPLSCAQKPAIACSAPVTAVKCAADGRDIMALQIAIDKEAMCDIWQLAKRCQQQSTTKGKTCAMTVPMGQHSEVVLS